MKHLLTTLTIISSSFAAIVIPQDPSIFVNNQVLEEVDLHLNKREDLDEDVKSMGEEDENFDLLEIFNPKQYEKATPILEICRKQYQEITSSAFLTSLQSQCEIVMGSLRITSLDSNTIDLGNIEEIQGDLIIDDSPDVVSLSASKLNKIGGTFSLNSLTSLVTVNVPALTYAKVIDWRIVPILNNVNINSNIKGLTSITISDSSLSSIDGFNNVKEIDVFNINNNRFLETLDSNIKNVKQQFSIHANAKELELRMPFLESAENITVRDTSSVYFPNLQKVSSSLEFIENLFTTLSLPNLESIGGTLGVIDNPNLNSVEFNNVSMIQGGLMVSNNSNLKDIDFFKSLKQIGGAIYFEGDFETTSFPELKLVKGSAFIKSSSDQLDCNIWTAPSGARSIVRGGQIKCASGKKEQVLSFDNEGTLVASKGTTKNEIKNTVENTSNLSGGSISTENFAMKFSPSFMCLFLQFSFTIVSFFI